MGTPGVPLKISKEKIVKTIKNHKGRIALIAEEFECTWLTMRRFIDKDPELVELLDEQRQHRDQSLCDMAEDTLTDAMGNRIEDMGNALKSAFFVLNNKGKDRGYNHPDAQILGPQLTPAQVMELANKSE